ncbi:MAG TPA: acyltransferase [Natronosporangium sp.]|nr:acyltransferase [Natronosporangium sp.]
MGVRQALATVNQELDTLVARTPARRDRYVDLLRAVAIGVVVVWHWSLSVLAWTGDRWVMPNPIHQVPGGWAATWLLQIMPVFFFVGGYANAAAWSAARRDGRGLAGYYRARLRRLLTPVGVFLAVWVAFEVTVNLVVPGYPGVLRYGIIAFTPLWFIAAYLWVVLLTPLTATAHTRARWWTLGLLAGAVAAADLARFAAGLDLAGWLNTALVWVLIHQFGYFYRDGTLDRIGRWGAVTLLAAGLLTLAWLTSLPAYPRSMVATVGQDRSNILPTTAPIAVVALAQVGVAMLLRAPVTRWLRRPAAWKPVVAANAVVMTVFLWHMTALLVLLAGLRAVGVEPPPGPDAAWWWQRPVWLLAPLPVLAVLVAVFGRFERGGGYAGRGAGGR